MKRLLHIAKSSSLLSIGIRGYYSVVSFGTTALLASVLSAAEFGRYSFLFSVALLVAGFAQSGLVQLLVRETSKTRNADRIRSFVRFSLVFVVVVTTVGFWIYLGWRWAAVGSWVSGSLIFGLIIGFSVVAILSATVRGLGRTLLGQLPDLVIRPTILVVGIGLVVLVGADPDEHSILMLHLAATFLGAGFSWHLYRIAIGSLPRSKPEVFQPRQWLKDMLGIASVGWVTTANAQLILIVTGMLAEDEVVGFLRIAIQFTALMALGLHAVQAVQYPRFAKYLQEGEITKVQRLMHLNVRFSLSIAIPISLVVFVAARPLLETLFSPEYGSAAPALKILAVGQVLSACVGSAGILLIASNHERLALSGSVLAFAVNMLLGAALIPHYGLLGAAISVSVSLMLRNFIYAAIAYRKLGILSLPFGAIQSGNDRV